MKGILVLVVLTSLYLLHYDFWLWQRADLVLGLPVGLAYHAAYCLVVAVAMALLLRVVGRSDSVMDD